ncbi:MAG: radical SAM protein [Butyricicoccus sp.]|nr:radical SAM protein [Butyricicoccus sp.]
MHFTGTIWRPPYEAGSLLLQATAGCTHHGCKFCTLYDDLPFRFRASPRGEIEDDLRDLQMLVNDPRAMLGARLQGLERPRPPRRVFLTGANPFVLSFERLEDIAQLVRRYLPQVESIGCFARVTDVGAKTDAQLPRLRAMGYDGLTIGAETGDNAALSFMNKGYAAQEIVRQARRLDGAGISYNFTYLAGISGAGRGQTGAKESARVFNQTKPKIIGSSMLTLYPNSALYGEVRAGRWVEAGELEKLAEIRTLIELLEIPVHFATLGASNAVLVEGELPRERQEMLNTLDGAVSSFSEEELQRYRGNLKHL